jgi:hypothetical protein
VLKSLLRSEDGNTLAVVALAFPFLIGSAGLAVDIFQWTNARNSLQKVADQAAIAGVNAVVQGSSPEAAVSDLVARNEKLDNSMSTQVNLTPESRPKDPFAVSVRLAAPARMTFSSLFVRDAFSITAEAVASVVENGDYCLLAMGTSDTGIAIQPGGRLESECGLSSNSSSPAAIQVTAGGHLDAPRVVAFGGIKGWDNPESSVARSFGLKQKDPYAHAEAPVVPGTGCPNVTVNPDNKGAGALKLKPGCYGNLVLNGNVVMQPGEYILNRGNFIVGPLGKVICNGCTLILTSRDGGSDPGSIGKVRIDAKANVKLTAPSDGPDPGLLIYQDPRAGREVPGEENRIGGNDFSKIDGIIYMPAQAIRIDGQGGANMSCSRLLGRALIIEGRVVIGKDCLGLDQMRIAGTEVRLVS